AVGDLVDVFGAGELDTDVREWSHRRLRSLVLIAEEADQHEYERLVDHVGMAEPGAVPVGVLTAIEEAQWRGPLVPRDGGVDVGAREGDVRPPRTRWPDGVHRCGGVGARRRIHGVTHESFLPRCPDPALPWSRARWCCPMDLRRRR